MPKSNKKIIFIIIAVLLVLIIAAGTTYILTRSNPDSKTNVVTEEQADTLKLQALDAQKNNDTTKQKALLEQAQAQYNELNKTDNKTNDQVDVEAQLWLLNHPGEPSTTSN